MVINPKQIDEVRSVISFLGRETDKGEVKDTHLLKTLSYLIEKQTEDYNKTLGKLHLTLGIGNRYIKENLEGLEYWDIITVSVIGNQKIWKWKGISHNLENNPDAQAYLEAKRGLKNENKISDT